MTTAEALVFQDPGLLWVLWLYHGYGLTDPTEWGRACLAWRYQLTRVEVDLVELIAHGCTNNQIAERLDLAEVNTVKNRINKIFEKMAVRIRILSMEV